LAAPLAALVVFTGAGFVSTLSDTTRVSAALAASAEKAPKDTAAAADQTGALPTVAEMTGRQADAFDELVAALRRTGAQVKKLDSQLSLQAGGLRRMKRATDGLTAPLLCNNELLGDLVAASEDAPAQLTEAAGLIRAMVTLQDRSIRHLRSINRKLAALDLLATATTSEALGRPEKLSLPSGKFRAGSGGDC
jgi:hypothetical protein